MSFDKYMQSYNHHHNLPKTFLLCLCGQSHPFIPASGKHSPDFYLYRFMFSRIQYKCNHICLASFTYHNAKIYLCCWVYQWFFFFFILPSRILLHAYTTTVYLSIHQEMDIWVASTFGFYECSSTRIRIAGCKVWYIKVHWQIWMRSLRMEVIVFIENQYGLRWSDVCS